MVDKNELVSGVNDFFSGDYELTDGNTIPNVGDISLGKTGREMELAMLFVDIKESTKIVDGFRRITAAKMYKSFLWGVTKIARSNNGELCSFNGDGILVAYNGESKCSNAGKSALQMKWFITEILKPKLKSYFENNSELVDIEFDCGIGIDVGEVLIVRAGIRGENNNDLVWVGNATNYAVKLSDLSKNGYMTYVSKTVYSRLDHNSKYGGEEDKNMWESRTWTDMNNMEIYRTNWHWTLS